MIKTNALPLHQTATDPIGARGDNKLIGYKLLFPCHVVHSTITTITLCSQLHDRAGENQTKVNINENDEFTTHKLCGRPPQYATGPCKLTQTSTCKGLWHIVAASRGVTWATSVPILVFLGLSVLDLGPMYPTNRQTDVKRASSFNASARWGWGHNNVT